MLRNEHELSVRRVLLAAPRFSHPVKRKRLALDSQFPAGCQLDKTDERRFGLVMRHVAEGESDDRERLPADVARAQRGLGSGRLTDLDEAGAVARCLDGGLRRWSPERIDDDVELTARGIAEA